MKIGLIGSTNVGKSTLFNTLIGSHRAIVTAIHGTTRDILYESIQVSLDGSVEKKRRVRTKKNKSEELDQWTPVKTKKNISEEELDESTSDETQHITLTFLDSPWLDTFDEEIPYLKQVIEVSDIILFMIDAHVGFAAKEQDIYQLIAHSWKKQRTVLVVNKFEKEIQSQQADLVLSEYYWLWFGYVYWVAAQTWLWMDKLRVLLREFARSFVWWEIIDGVQCHESTDVLKLSKNLWWGDKWWWPINLAIIGRPNAGKSTLLNKLLWEDRALVSEIPWTTLDYNVWEFELDGQSYRLYDTAGIKREWKMYWLEKIAYEKTKTMLKYVRPLVIYLVDAEVWMTHRDMSLVGEILWYNLALIVCLNKVDAINRPVRKERKVQMESFLNFASHIPLLTISGQYWEWLLELFTSILWVWWEYHKRIDTSELNQILSQALIHRPPKFPKNKICKISYITQVDVATPTFMVSVNKKEYCNFSFVRWLENTIRLSFGFVGVPLQFFWRNKRVDGRDLF